MVGHSLALRIELNPWRPGLELHYWFRLTRMLSHSLLKSIRDEIHRYSLLVVVEAADTGQFYKETVKPTWRNGHGWHALCFWEVHWCLIFRNYWGKRPSVVHESDWSGSLMWITLFCRLFESVARSCMQQKQAPPRETSETSAWITWPLQLPGDSSAGQATARMTCWAMNCPRETSVDIAMLFVVCASFF